MEYCPELSFLNNPFTRIMYIIFQIILFYETIFNSSELLGISQNNIRDIIKNYQRLKNLWYREKKIKFQK